MTSVLRIAVVCGGLFLGMGVGIRGVSAVSETPPGFSQVIYFDTASTTPASGSLDPIVAWTRESRGALIVEGHADERGGSDYNLELGDRRARQVKADLMARGVSADRLVILSRGEADPASATHAESGWRENRRVVVYPMIGPK